MTGKRDLLNVKRRQSLMSQIEVAAKLGISQASYSYIENGYSNPNEEQAKQLVEMFGLPNDYFDEEGEKVGQE